MTALSRFILVLVLLLCCGCAVRGGDLSAPSKAKNKNVILIIGDGFGPQQLGLAWLYAKYAPNSTVPDRTLNIERMMQQGSNGVVMTPAKGRLVVDSACAMTQLAAGADCVPGTIGIDETGNWVQSALDFAQRAGKSTGLVTDTRVTHATPAGFATHVLDRNQENEIARQYFFSSPTVILGGGLRHFLPGKVNQKDSTEYHAALDLIGNEQLLLSQRDDDLNLLELASNRGYQLVFDRAGLASANTNEKILGLFAKSGMPDGISHSRSKDSPTRTTPTLCEMADKALAVLAQNNNGFFLMIEAGQIDWAGHANDVGWMLHEVLRLDELVGCVNKWAAKRTDTIVILTADHETGSFGFSYSLHDLQGSGQSLGERSQQLPPLRYNFGKPETLDQIYQQCHPLGFIFKQFDALPKANQSAEKLMELVNSCSEFEISFSQALEVLATTPNRFYNPQDKELSAQRAPKIQDFDAYYPKLSENRIPLLARKLAEQQNVVWGTGTHTSTPVLVTVTGDVQTEEEFEGIYHQRELGRKIMELVNNEPIKNTK